ncbi:hypothetical protein I7I53_00330 [Histoplasma capsulatum var. duboisii H88]|uniref:Uncharacterized protein n=1 Tax=Ajellomyces capsulatus (strain H88) TaxID=544711 RepID=A0A8A1LGX1_AJEC8|nr:hypothetical protein I7I53_00330 [Histoplasma capsulatum var. duboisii H88]
MTAKVHRSPVILSTGHKAMGILKVCPNLLHETLQPSPMPPIVDTVNPMRVNSPTLREPDRDQPMLRSLSITTRSPSRMAPLPLRLLLG